MENKNNITAIVIVGIVGIFIGWLIWGHSAKPQVVQSTRGMAHMMPDGTMMGGNTDMSAMMANMNAGLQGKTGDAFDQEFIAEMIREGCSYNEAAARWEEYVTSLVVL
jgi:hypothetical protein